MTDFEKEISGHAAVNKYQRDRDLEAMEFILGSRQGRRVIYTLLGVCHFGRSAFGGTNEITNFHAGKQSVGEHIMGLLNLTSPEAYTLMVKEAKEDEDNDRRTFEQRTDATSTDSSRAFATADTGGSQPR